MESTWSFCALRLDKSGDQEKEGIELGFNIPYHKSGLKKWWFFDTTVSSRLSEVLLAGHPPPPEADG